MDPTSIPFFQFDTGWVALVQLGLVVILPTLVGLVTNKFAATWAKVLILGVLSLLGNLGTQWLDSVASGTAFDWLNLVGNGIVGLLVSQLSYFGILKPWGVIDKVQGISALQIVPASQKKLAAAGLSDSAWVPPTDLAA